MEKEQERETHEARRMRRLYAIRDATLRRYRAERDRGRFWEAMAQEIHDRWGRGRADYPLFDALLERFRPRSVLDLKRPPTAPGEMLLEEYLKPAGLTQSAAAERMRIPLNRLNEIIRGRRAITADTAIRLGRLFKMSPEFWMGLQVDWDLWHAHQAMKRATA